MKITFVLDNQGCRIGLMNGRLAGYASSKSKSGWAIVLVCGVDLEVCFFVLLAGFSSFLIAGTCVQEFKRSVRNRLIGFIDEVKS